MTGQDPGVRVSIVMPAYNAADTIGRAITSALRQTEPSLEVIVIDDASTDATAAIVARLAEQDDRVRLLRQNANRGPGAARNRGFASARGVWIALLDADDEFVPYRIARLADTAEHYGADIIADNLLLCGSQNGQRETPMISHRALPEPKWMSPAEFVAGNVGSRYTPRVSYGFLQPLMRRAFLETHDLRYEEQNRFGEDFLLSLACLLKGARWWVTPEPMYRYMVRFGTATDVQSAADLLRIRTIEEELLRSHPMVAADPALADALRRHKAVIEHFYYYRAFTDALKAKNFAPATHFLLQSLSSFRHILTESAMQAPRVTMKALRGGYRRPPSQVRRMSGAGAPGHSGRQL